MSKLITPHEFFILSSCIKMFRAGAPGPVQILICLLTSLQIISWAITEVRPAALEKIWHPSGKHKQDTWPDIYSSRSNTRMECLGEVPLFKSDSNKRWRAQMQPLFESFAGPLLKSGVGLSARYRNHQEIKSGRLEQMYTSSNTRLGWPVEGRLFESDSNKCRGPNQGQC